MDSNYQKAFVIHSRPYKETSLIVTFLSENNGKINAVAKGAKRKNSRLSGNLEPFQCLNIDFRGRSDLKTLYLKLLLFDHNFFPNFLLHKEDSSLSYIYTLLLFEYIYYI